MRRSKNHEPEENSGSMEEEEVMEEFSGSPEESGEESQEEEAPKDESYKMKASKWGKNKQNYYQESDSEESENIQEVLEEAKTLKEQLGVAYRPDQFYNPADLAFNSSKNAGDEEKDSLEHNIEIQDEVSLVKNLKKKLLALDAQERDELAMKHFPEIPAIYVELETNLKELEETTQIERNPALKEANNGFLRDFFRYKKLTLVSYVSSLAYYLWHISKGEIPHDHPVAGVLSKQKETLDQLMENSPTIEALLEAAEREMSSRKNESQPMEQEDLSGEESEEESEDSFLGKVMAKRGEKRERKNKKALMIEERRAAKRREIEGVNTAQEEGFRPISAKILKNRGLMRQRSKKDKAISRVKHRNKYEKALYKLKVGFLFPANDFCIRPKDNSYGLPLPFTKEKAASNLVWFGLNQSNNYAITRDNFSFLSKNKTIWIHL